MVFTSGVTQPTFMTERIASARFRRCASRPMLTAAVIVVAPAALTACGSSPAATSAAKAPSTTTSTAVVTTGTGGCPAQSGSNSGGAESAPPGDIPDNQAYVSFGPAGGGYNVMVPEGWARTESGTTVSFTDKLNTIRVELIPAPSAPTPTSAQATEAPNLKASTACGDVKVTTLSRPAGQAVLLSYQTRSAPDPVTGRVYRDDVERYEFWKGGTEAVITLSSPAGSDNVDPWRKVTSSFAWST